MTSETCAQGPCVLDMAAGEFVEAAQCVVELAQPAHPHIDGEARQQREFAAEQRSATLLQVRLRESTRSPAHAWRGLV